MPGRPWANEVQAVGGDRLSPVALFYLGILVILIGSWLKSANPMLSSAFGVLGIKGIVEAKMETLTPGAEYPLENVVRYLDVTPTAALNLDEMVKETMAWYQDQYTETPAPPTLTPTITPTATETPYQYPTVTMTPEAEYEMIAKISYYWPPLCGTDKDPNCINGDHNIYTAAALDDWVARAVAGEKILACPDSFMFGTRFVIFDDVWTCWDRGGAIVWDGNKIWVDLLAPEMPYPIEWGTEVKVYIMPPSSSYN